MHPSYISSFFVASRYAHDVCHMYENAELFTPIEGIKRNVSSTHEGRLDASGVVDIVLIADERK